MQKLKPHKEYPELINRIKDKNITIDIGDDSCVELLKSINYYRLSAYWRPFAISNDNCNAVPFSKIIDVYNFDKKLQAILFTSINTIETYMRSQIAYYHTLNFGALGYECIESFNTNIDRFKQQKETIDNCLARAKDKPDIKHHSQHYNDILPLWVIIEYFTFGLLSKFCNNMKTQEQKTISKNIGIHIDSLRSYLRCLTDLRNRVAHHSRLYHIIFPTTPLLSKNIDFKSDRSLFSQLSIFKDMYYDKKLYHTEFLDPLKHLINEYQNSINLSHIGFPDNWEEIMTP